MNLPKNTAKAMIDVLQTLQDAGRLPSDEVQRKAYMQLEGKSVAQRAGWHLVFYSHGSEPQPYLTVLTAPIPGLICDVYCTCPATTMCSHIVAALTLAKKAGNTIDLDNDPPHPADARKEN